ncbi:hypothetical protein Pvag_pPag30324 (plasmid) [Pantoea vagans C9-1]|nr:hypothetical protein Pvag_pPag30324 [Pantoea vagans C9-1]
MPVMLCQQRIEFIGYARANLNRTQVFFFFLSLFCRTLH